MDTSALVILLGTDPIPWLRTAEEPFTRLTLRRELLGRPDDDPGVLDARGALLLDRRVLDLIARLPEWGDAEFPGHHSPEFLPNHLNLLADMGLRRGDADRVDALLDRMMEHQDAQGRFESFGTAPGRSDPAWGSMLCDTNVIADVLCRFGHGGDERTQTALERITKDLTRTPQGLAWQCIPDRRTRWRGPGRKADVCPQVTLEGLRALSHLEPAQRPRHTIDVARTALEVWRRRADERPYAFGHGYQFKSVKWPNFWYDVLWVLETLSRFPELWRGQNSVAEDRRAIAELAACLVAYNFDADGRVVPKRIYRGFSEFSFGQKREPSPFATARALVPLLRMTELAEEIAAIDVEALGSSKGGTGTPRPPKRTSTACPVPETTRELSAANAVPRVLHRHHIDTPWIATSVESLVADIVGLRIMSPTGPYASLHARIPRFDRATLDSALHERRALLRMRCMRGAMFVIRPDIAPAAFASTSRPVIRHAREFARVRGIDPATYERLAPHVIDLLDSRSLTTAEIRERLGVPIEADVAALVNLLCCEGHLLRDRPTNGWRGRKWTYTPMSRAFPGLHLESVREEDGDVALLRGYVRAFGPATRKDAGWWTGIGIRRVDQALDALGDEIATVRLRGTEETLLVHAADLDELEVTPAPEGSVVFLPSVDPLLMGYANKGRFVSDAVRPYVFDRHGNVTSAVLVDGHVAGVWDIASDQEPAILVHLFEEPHAALRGTVLEKAAALGRFWYDTDVPVHEIANMAPLVDRPYGSVVKPLR